MSALYRLKCKKKHQQYEELQVDFDLALLKYQTNFINGVDIGHLAEQFGLVELQTSEGINYKDISNESDVDILQKECFKLEFMINHLKKMNLEYMKIASLVHYSKYGLLDVLPKQIRNLLYKVPEWALEKNRDNMDIWLSHFDDYDDNQIISKPEKRVTFKIPPSI